MRSVRDGKPCLSDTSEDAQRVLNEANKQLGTEFTLKTKISDLPVDVFAELVYRINAYSFVQCSPNR